MIVTMHGCNIQPNLSLCGRMNRLWDEIDQSQGAGELICISSVIILGGYLHKLVSTRLLEIVRGEGAPCMDRQQQPELTLF